ncbi:bifunctional riboflavin kinase/FAD synthetase [Hydrogenimonas sp.]
MSGSTAILINNDIEAIAIGNFDGMHIGHQALFSKLGKHGAIVVIEHFRATLTPHIYRARYTSYPLCLHDFGKVRDKNPEEFVSLLRHEFPSLKRIVVGDDFHFGLDRSGDVETLKSLFAGEVVIVKEVAVGQTPVHSRFIRKEIEAGNIKKANEMLGHPYEIWGEVIKGQGIGAKELVPTINLSVSRFLLPKEGVYVTTTCIEGREYPSVTFIGHRVTTDGDWAVETHLIDADVANVQGKICIRWHSFLRENRKFDSFESLKIQIGKDIEDACGA